MKIHNTRAIACLVLQEVVKDGKSFQPQLISRYSTSTQDHSFIAHLCFGVLRFYPRLHGWISKQLHQPLKSKDLDVMLLLMVGLYQLFYTDAPAYAVVHSTVEAANDLKKAWARGLINSVLRRLQEKGPLISPDDPLPIRTAHPTWLVKALQQAWPQQWENIIAANLEHPPYHLRVNVHQLSREQFLAQLAAQHLSAEPLPFTASGVQLNSAVPVTQLPGFEQGWFSVQDGAGQFAAELLELHPGLRVLDACAAPGSKTTHILEHTTDLSVVALDNDEQRLNRLKENLQRLRLSAEARLADASQPEAWWDGQLFDRILLDAPCSATGVIRRHPDIKLHRKAEDIPMLVKKQTLLLEKLWPLLKPGGILVYATCSILPQENVEQIINFQQAHADAHGSPILEEWGMAQAIGRQLLPGQHHMDGFYYAKIVKQQ